MRWQISSLLKTFVIMGIVVELGDRSLANAGIQKAGHLFPGQRATCYSSDLCCGSTRH